MDRAHEIAKFDRQTLGFDIEIWLRAMRGQILAVLGRYDEARPFLDRVLELEEGHVDAIHHVIPSLAYVDIAWAEGDPVLAQTHAERAFSLAVKSGSPYLRVYAQACRGLAYTIAGQLGSAIDDLSSALRFARSRKAGLENEARILADMANAYRLSGDTASALATVDEAIKIATIRHARFPECLARIVRADILSQSRAAEQRAAASDERNRAETLMLETGALIFERFIKDAATDAETAMPRQFPPIAG
jgi:adenylate cyclase